MSENIIAASWRIGEISEDKVDGYYHFRSNSRPIRAFICIEELPEVKVCDATAAK